MIKQQFEQSLLVKLNLGDLSVLPSLYETVHSGLYRLSSELLVNKPAVDRVVFNGFVDFWLRGPAYRDLDHCMNKTVLYNCQRLLKSTFENWPVWWTDKIEVNQGELFKENVELEELSRRICEGFTLPADIIRRICIDHYIRMQSNRQISRRYKVEKDVVLRNKKTIIELLSLTKAVSRGRHISSVAITGS
ncbi:hypothetical protein PV783_13660 [Chitinophaga sp. CC14]|uniref:hypothetical protein n=1 Tax=Chitinophaga sp. CC14 TaxID=3029199 RepID=UPI003B7B4E3F